MLQLLAGATATPALVCIASGADLSLAAGVCSQAGPCLVDVRANPNSVAPQGHSDCVRQNDLLSTEDTT